MTISRDLFHSQCMAFIELSYLPGEVHFNFGLPRLIPSTAMGGEGESISSVIRRMSYFKCVTAFRRTGYDRVYPAALVAAYMTDYKSDSVHTLNEEEQLRWCENRAKEADALIQASDTSRSSTSMLNCSSSIQRYVRHGRRSISRTGRLSCSVFARKDTRSTHRFPSARVQVLTDEKDRTPIDRTWIRR